MRELRPWPQPWTRGSGEECHWFTGSCGEPAPGGPKPAGVPGLEVFDPLGQVLGLVGSGGFVSVRHQHEGRVIAVHAEDAFRLGVDPGIDRLSIAEGGGLVGPTGGLDMEVHAEFVGGGEGGFGRAMGVKAEMIQAVGLGGPDHLRQTRRVDRRSRFREDGAFEGPAQVEGTSVDGELCSVGSELAPSEGHFTAIHRAVLGAHFHRDHVKIRIELVPGAGQVDRSRVRWTRRRRRDRIRIPGSAGWRPRFPGGSWNGGCR